MQRVQSPRKRCAFCMKNGVQIIFLVLPKCNSAAPPPTVAVEPEPLMFFDSAPLIETPKPIKRMSSVWSSGQVVTPLVVNGNGELVRCSLFKKMEFTDLNDAYNQCGPFDAYIEYPTVFGCILLDKVYFLVASKVEEAVHLPFGRSILRVVGTEWVPFAVPGAAMLRITPTDRNRLREFQNYSYGKGYFYSDDCDLTKPFPFVSGDESPELYCDWSEHLRQPFRARGFNDGCSILIRGFTDEKTVDLRDGSILHVMLLGRQNHLNPGPRYLGRGLNETNAVGNDHFYEYVMWKESANGSFSFARHVILRGTIPVRWATQINATIAEPSMVFNPNKEEVLRGCDVYFERVFSQLTSLIKYDAADSTTNVAPKLRCVNLLRQGPQHPEGLLARYFLEAVRRSDSTIRRRFPNGHLDLVHVDWLNSVKDYGIDMATKVFWDASVNFLIQSNTESLATVGTVHADGNVERFMWQSRFVRVNCADSLDRTNLGCFFTCIQASIFMLRSLGLGLDSFLDQKPLPSLNGQESADGDGFSAFLVPIPGAKSAVPKPYINLWSEARDPSIYPVSIGRALAELHVYNGDVVAQLYTNSAAMHGNILRGICGLKSTASNMVIATQRLYENVFEDRKKFRSIELLLGRNKDIHFQSMSQVFLTRPVPFINWGCALIAVGVPQGVQVSEIDTAVRNAWDSMVLPTLQSEGPPPIPSTALCFEVSLPEDEMEAHQAFASAVSQVKFEDSSPVEDEANVPLDKEQICVIEFDLDLCRAVDVPRLLRERSVLNVEGSNVILAPYTYPIQNADEGSSGLVQKAANSLRSGIKSFVRGLNH